MSVIEARLAGLVHASAQEDAVARRRHERFIVTRAMTGAIALALLPPYLVWRGTPSWPESLAILCLVAPLIAAVMLARTGLLGLAHALSSAALTGLVVSIATVSGGAASPMAIWLVAVPLEALLSGSRRAATGASAIAALGALAIVVLDRLGLSGVQGGEAWPIAIAMPVLAVTALAHAAAQAVAHARDLGDQDRSRRARDAQDRSLLQVIDDLVTWHDRNGQVLHASPAAAKLLGVAPAQLLGRGLFFRIHVSDRPIFLKAVSDAAACERPVAAEFRLHVGPEGGDAIGAPGRVTWVEMRAHRVHDGTGGVVAVTRDVSERKRHEEELEAARAAAERADRSKGVFLATVSHELRTPLNAIIGFSEILGTEHFLVEEERRREYAHIIRDSGAHLLSVVNTLLDMSKIEAGSFELCPEPFDLRALVAGCCDLMALKAEASGLRLNRELGEPGALPELVGDRRACRQIVINLLSNAAKFTPPGGEVTVGLRREGDRAVVTVADTGCGIAEADLPRLGDPFFQAGSVYERPHEGTGLGLSVVRGLVGLHRGTLAIESAPGAGTGVTVSLPLDCRGETSKTRSPEARIQARPRRAAVLRAG